MNNPLELQHGDIFEYQHESMPKDKMTYILVSLDTPWEAWMLISENNTIWCPPATSPAKAFGDARYMKYFRKIDVSTIG